jgi:predicted AlkP superfamily phosphohydrolase/phosphomutase
MDRLLHEFGYLDFSASNAVFGPMQWGPVRKVARKVYDTLGLHGKVALPQSVNWSKTRAYTTIRSTGEGVSINLAGRDIDGIVDPGDYDKVRDELMDRLGSYVDPKTGKSPVKSIAKREDVFPSGKFAETAPDIMMVPNEGYSLTHAKSAIEDADWVSGDHRMEGVIVAVGPNVKPFSQTPSLIDMAPTLVAALDAPTAVKPTGRVLTEIVGGEGALVEREVAADDAGSTANGPQIPGMTIPGMGGESAVNETEADEMEEHLRGLGYIE